MTPEELTGFVAAEVARWRPLAEEIRSKNN
jgi:hypothetical protein